MKVRVLLLMIAVVNGFSFRVSAQGCSDAGICMIKNFKPEIPTLIERNLNQVSAGMNIGQGDHSILVILGSLGYSRGFGNHFSVDTRLTYGFQNGNNISVSSPGDAFANINYLPTDKLAFTVGLKYPLTTRTQSFEGKVLPLDYHTSLGTMDFLAGVKFTFTKLQLLIAYQEPIKTISINNFNPALWAQDSPLHEFQDTRMFDRKGDILMRISYPLEMNQKITLTPGLLPIYHLGEDTFLDGEKIQGSSGLTINATLFMDLALRAKNKLGFSLGFPLLVRQARPDGLTRSFVLGAEYSVFF